MSYHTSQIYFLYAMPLPGQSIIIIIIYMKVVIEKVDDRYAERIMRTEILDRITSHRRPSDLLGQLQRRWRNS